MHDMDASRPLLEKEHDRFDSHSSPSKKQRHRVRKNSSGRALVDPNAPGYECLSRLFPPASATSDSSGRDSFSSGSASPVGALRNGYEPHRDGREQLVFTIESKASRGSSSKRSGGICSDCSEWYCWKWVFPDRIVDYDDFVTSAQMGEIHHIRDKARELFDPSAPDDSEMLHHLWNGLFPMLPFEGRVNPRWRDIGFQNDDPASDLRASGRLALQMLLYFADHANDEFKRMIRENRFPVCLCALNLLEVLLVHLNLKDPLPLVCPCCGTDNAELETSQPSRPRPELQGFIAILDDATGAAASTRHSFAEWPVETALAQLFTHAMVVLDAVWKHKLQRDPTTTLMHFREALVDTRVRLVAFLSRRNSPLTLVELAAWSYSQKSKLRAATKAL